MFGYGNFYHETLKRYTVLFGTLFNDISISKKDENGVVVKDVKVPISFGPKEKFLARIEADPDLSKHAATVLPRMSFEIVGMNYMPDRKLTSTGRRSSPTTANTSAYTFVRNPVPYDIQIRLDILVRTYDDGCQIVEQILPFFKPDWTPKVQIVDDPVQVIDVPIVLTSVSISDNYDGNFAERKTLIWTLDFVLKGYFFGPPNTVGVIKFANTQLYASDYGSNATSVAIISAQPGLDANGNPTTDPALSISPLDISVSDNWAYAFDITEF